MLEGPTLGDERAEVFLCEWMEEILFESLNSHGHWIVERLDVVEPRKRSVQEPGSSLVGGAIVEH